jgi:hypothetical protein
MQSSGANTRGPRLALGAVLIAASMTLTGCSTIAALPTHATHKPVVHTPAPTKTASHYTTQATSAGYVYKDALSGYAVTFPDEPDVKPLAINGSNRLGNAAISSDLATIELFSRGEVRDSPPNLRGELMGWIQSVETSGQIGASSYQLGGLDGARAEFTIGGDQEDPDFLVGKEGETVVASEGNRFYQLIALGGTPEQRQVFFDSFTRIDG